MPPFFDLIAAALIGCLGPSDVWAAWPWDYERYAVHSAAAGDWCIEARLYREAR